MSSSLTETRLVDVTMPQMGVSVAEGTIIAWRVAVGDPIEAEQTIVEISTDKIDSEVPRRSPARSPRSWSSPTRPSTSARCSVGSRSATFPRKRPRRPPTPTAQTPSDGTRRGTPVAAPAPPPDQRRYSPVVQRIAAEHDVDLASVTGTGRGGRVRKQDVLALVNGNGGGPTPRPPEPPMHIESPYRPDPDVPSRPRTPAPVPAVTGSSEGLSRMRRTIGQRMKQSLDTAATCTTWIEVDMARVETARAALGVTALAFVARATVQTLREFPALNAWLNGEAYSRVDDVNLGIAVSLGEDGPDRAGHPPRAGALDRGAGDADPRHRQARAGGPADRRRRARRHVHDHQPRASTARSWRRR